MCGRVYTDRSYRKQCLRSIEHAGRRGTSTTTRIERRDRAEFVAAVTEDPVSRLFAAVRAVNVVCIDLRATSRTGPRCVGQRLRSIGRCLTRVRIDLTRFVCFDCLAIEPDVYVDILGL